MEGVLKSDFKNYNDYLKQFKLINKMTFNLDYSGDKNTTTMELHVSDDGKEGVIRYRVDWEDKMNFTETWPITLYFENKVLVDYETLTEFAGEAPLDEQMKKLLRK